MFLGLLVDEEMNWGMHAASLCNRLCRGVHKDVAFDPTGKRTCHFLSRNRVNCFCVIDLYGWTDWSDCSATCGPATQQRSAPCPVFIDDSSICVMTQTRECPHQPDCPTSLTIKTHLNLIDIYRFRPKYSTEPSLS